MKIKAFILAGFMVAVVGFIVFAVAMTNLDWKFSIQSNYEQKTYTIEEEETPPTALEIRADYADVTVARGEETKIEYDDSDKLGYAFAKSGGKLTATQTQKNRFFSLWLFRRTAPRIKVTLSPDCTDAVVKVNSGTLAVSDHSFRALTVENKNGAIVLARVDADSTTVVNKNGKIEIDGLICRGDVSVNNKNGNIALKNCDADGAVGVENKNGNVILSRVGCTVVTVDDSNGDVTLTDVSADKLVVNAYNGDMECKGIVCPKIYAKAYNGDIEFTVVGSASDYVIVTKNSHGDVHAPQSGSGDKRIELINKNGDIELKFESEG